MIQQPYDHRLLHYLQKRIRQLPLAEQFLYRSTLYCGSKVSRLPHMHEGVFLLSNGEDSRLFGLNTCKNSWYCPACAAKVMSKYAANIACLIEALEEKGQWAFMLTLTIPHTSGISCEESTEILYQSWKDFNVHGNKNQHSKYYSRKDKKRVKMIVSDKKNKDVFASFCEEFHCIHRVRVAEYTWGEHGWHPHFHTLFFVDKTKFQKVKEWQDKIAERWQAIVRKNTLKMWKKLNPDKSIQGINNRWEFMLTQSGDYQRKSPMAYISVDKSGKVIRQRSSNYICGWGADKELTGNVSNKAAHDGHLTPYQILEKAAEGNEKMWDLYFQYMQAVRKKLHRRINFSKGAKQIIQKWKQTKAYKEYIKKKHMQDKRDKWELVCWFTSKQWSKICEINEDTPIISNILYLATKRDKELIAYYLNLYDIKLENETVHKEFIENLYNDQLSETYTGEAQEEVQVA